MGTRKYHIIASVGFLLLAGCQTTKYGYKEEKGQLTVYEMAAHRKDIEKTPLGRKLNSTADRLERQIEKNPGDVDARNKLARIYMSQGKLKEAEGLVKQSLRADFRNTESVFLMANIAYFRYQNDLAQLILDKLGGAKSQDPRVLNLMALIHVRKSEDQEAINLLELAVKKKGDLTAEYINLGLLRLKYLHVSRAKAAFAAALQHSSDSLDAKVHLAMTQAISGEYGKAKQTYAEVQRITSDHPLIEYNRAVLLYRLQDYEKALNGLEDYLGSIKGKERDGRALALMREIRQQLAIENVAKEDSVKDALSDIKAANSDDFSLEEGYIFTNVGPMTGH